MTAQRQQLHWQPQQQQLVAAAVRRARAPRAACVGGRAAGWALPAVLVALLTTRLMMRMQRQQRMRTARAVLVVTTGVAGALGARAGAPAVCLVTAPPLLAATPAPRSQGVGQQQRVLQHARRQQRQGMVGT
jgi:hypothetical protein